MNEVSCFLKNVFEVPAFEAETLMGVYATLQKSGLTFALNLGDLSEMKGKSAKIYNYLFDCFFRRINTCVFDTIQNDLLSSFKGSAQEKEELINLCEHRMKDENYCATSFCNKLHTKIPQANIYYTTVQKIAEETFPHLLETMRGTTKDERKGEEKRATNNIRDHFVSAGLQFEKIKNIVDELEGCDTVGERHAQLIEELEQLPLRIYKKLGYEIVFDTQSPSIRIIGGLDKLGDATSAALQFGKEGVFWQSFELDAKDEVTLIAFVNWFDFELYD